MIQSLFIGILLSNPALAEDCDASIGTCQYYLCREANRPCNEKGYFLNFGYKYCHKSLDDKLVAKVSPQGKTWLIETATCLQRRLAEIDDVNTCAEIKREAIAGHDVCYLEAHFCELKFSDKIQILKTISPAFKEKGVLIEGIQVLHSCIKAFKQYELF